MMINENGVERQATKEEIAQHAADNAAREAHNKSVAEKVAAREALFNKLGLSNEDANLIFG